MKWTVLEVKKSFARNRKQKKNYKINTIHLNMLKSLNYRESLRWYPIVRHGENMSKNRLSGQNQLIRIKKHIGAHA